VCVCMYVFVCFLKSAYVRVSMYSTQAIGMPSVCVRVWAKEEYVYVYVCIYFLRCCACKYV